MRIRTTLAGAAVSVLAIGGMITATQVAHAAPAPAAPAVSADVCAVLNAEGVGKLRATVLANVEMNEDLRSASDGTLAAAARIATGCGLVAPSTTGAELTAKLCVNLDLAAIRALLVNLGGEGVAEQITAADIDRARQALNCASVPATTPSTSTVTTTPATTAPSAGETVPLDIPEATTLPVGGVDTGYGPA